jgi:hypothetical protein
MFKYEITFLSVYFFREELNPFLLVVLLHVIEYKLRWLLSKKSLKEFHRRWIISLIKRSPSCWELIWHFRTKSFSTQYIGISQYFNCPVRYEFLVDGQLSALLGVLKPRVWLFMKLTKQARLNSLSLQRNEKQSVRVL